jgi:uncharacterized alkaline shock family protein YloU
MSDAEANTGVTLAPGVVETIIALAAVAVDGVAQVGNNTLATGVKQAFSKKHPVSGVIVLEEDGELKVELNIQVYYGHKLTQIAGDVRLAVVEALESQVDINIQKVDITIDGVVFEQQA